METKVEDRLRELRDEYATGQKMMVELQNRQAELQQTLLRISGAIQVLEELSSPAAPTPAGSVEPPPPAG